MIEVRNLTFSYFNSKTLFKNLNFSIERGKFVVITGPSTCGKTTLAYCLSGVIPHIINGKMCGNVFVDGKDTKKVELGWIMRRVGVVLQNPEAQIFGMTVEEDLYFALENLGFEEAVARRRVEKFLKMFELDQFRKKNPLVLSGGQKQKLAIASVLVVEPEILILDEPFSNLDFKSRKAILKILERLKRRGKTIILIERSFYDFSCLIDEILVLNNGKLLGVFPPDEFFENEEILKKSKIFVPIHLFMKSLPRR